MRLERILIATTAALSILASTSLPFSATSSARASSLPGGQIFWCTLCVPALACNTCLYTFKCNSYGNYDQSQNNNGSNCTSCQLGTQSNCGGDYLQYDTDDCSGIIINDIGACPRLMYIKLTTWSVPRAPLAPTTALEVAVVSDRWAVLTRSGADHSRIDRARHLAHPGAYRSRPDI